jgi:hypothetical protein
VSLSINGNYGDTLEIQAPFPWFGGKSTVADLVWSRFGNVPNYVEPFFGSGAVLLGRPHAPKVETVNDLDGLVANFWRAIQYDPEETARWADNPVNEADLHARHMWIVQRLETHQARMMADPDYFDARMAGYWVYGLCSWIGSGFASGNGPWIVAEDAEGVLTLVDSRQLPHLGNAGMGINRQLPHLRNAGMGINRKREGIQEWFLELADRLRDVRVCCGDWKRVMGESVTVKHGMTAVFLDPPYGAEDRADLYRAESFTVAREVTEWCLENGSNPMLRIALCGYEGETHHALEDAGWNVLAWKARGGYGSQGEEQGRANAERERIWFSPACIGAERGLFDTEAV